MTENSKDNDIVSDFSEVFALLSDVELKDVLKKRKHYQKEAAKQAIQEALKRGIIHSEQDLFSEEYEVEPLRFALFPEVENETARNKIRKSLGRSLMIVGILPLVWGGLNILRSRFLEGLILVGLGGLWTFISFQLLQKNYKMIIVLYLLLGAAAMYLLKFFSARKTIDFMDIFISAIVFGLVLYGIMFIQKLK